MHQLPVQKPGETLKEFLRRAWLAQYQAGVRGEPMTDIGTEIQIDLLVETILTNYL